jgi:hypothetical protein
MAALKNAAAEISKGDMTIDACHGIITALMGSVLLHQLRSIDVLGSTVTIHSHRLAESGEVTFEGGSLVQNFRMAAVLVYEKVALAAIGQIGRFVAGATTFEQLFDAVSVLELVRDSPVAVMLWEDLTTACVSVCGFREQGSAGTQVAVFRQALLGFIKGAEKGSEPAKAAVEVETA